MGSPRHVYLASLIVTLTIILTTIQGIHGVIFQVGKTVAEANHGKYFNPLKDDQEGRRKMKVAANFIWEIFEQRTNHDKKPVKKITLFIHEIDEPSAYKINGGDCEIHISATELRKHANVIGDDAARQIFKELLYYEMTHILQWTANDEIREALKDGIAAFMVLKVDYNPRGWAKKGEGNFWDERKDVTARFLQYCESFYIDFIAKLNKKLKNSYSETIFPELLGHTTQEMWDSYKKKYGRSEP